MDCALDWLAEREFMATAASPALEKKMARNPGKIGMVVFGVALLVGVI